MRLNNYIDRDIDHLMERTKTRPTVTGKVNPNKVAIMGTYLFYWNDFFSVYDYYSSNYRFIGVFSYVVVYSMWSKRQACF